MIKPLFSIVLILVFSMPLKAKTQPIDPWIKQKDYIAYMYPSFVNLQRITTTVDLTSYCIGGKDRPPSNISLKNYPITQRQALTMAFVFMGNYNVTKYKLSKDKANIIPFNGGFILCGYRKDSSYWEFACFPAATLPMVKPYRLYSLEEK